MPEIKLRNKIGFKLMLVLLFVLLFLLLSSSAALAAMMGDVNGDGRINVADVVLVQKHILTQNLTTAQQAVADVNGDGVINVRDATLIMQYSLGLISEFPAGPSTPGVKSVRAIASHTIAVEFFDTPSVAEKAALTITIRNVSNLEVPTLVTWDENVAKVSRLLNLSFSAATYSVEVEGITPPYNGYVVFTAASAVNVKIEATSLPVNTARAPLRIRLVDQYGNDLPMIAVTFTTTAYNLTTHTPVTINFDPTAHFYIDTRLRIPHVEIRDGNTTTIQRHAFSVGDQIRVTFVHRATGIEETVTIPVTPQIQLGSITFGDIILPPLRTVLTRDLTNVRIPFTAKDQNGNPMILDNGANVRLYSSDQSVVSNSNLRFAWFDGKQYILIERFVNKGPVIISVLGIPDGVLGNKFLNVEERLPYRLEVVTEPLTTLRPFTSTVIRLRIVDQFGRVVSPAEADRDFEIVTIKSSQGDIYLSAPLHNHPYSPTRAGSTGIRITSGDTTTKVFDSISFRLQRKSDRAFVDSVFRSIYVIRDYRDLIIQPDRLSGSYTAGENIYLNIKAMLDGRIHEDYNDIVRAEITTRMADGTILDREVKTLVFRNGVADEVFIRAKKAGTGLGLFVRIDGVDHRATTTINIAPGLPSKFVITAELPRTLVVKLTDSEGNVIETNEGWLLQMSYPEAFNGKVIPPLDNNDRITAVFPAAGFRIDFRENLVRGAYTVEDERGEIRGSITLNP